MCIALQKKKLALITKKKDRYRTSKSLEHLF